MHDIVFAGGRSETERIVFFALRAAENIVRRCAALAQRNLKKRRFTVLNRVDQRLAETEKLCLLCNIVHINTAAVLKPDHRNPVSLAEHHKLTHLDEALTIELAANTNCIRTAILRIVHKEPLLIGDDTYKQTIQARDATDHFRAIVRLIFIKLARVGKAGDDLINIIGALRIHGNDTVQIIRRKSGLHRRRDPEKLKIKTRNVAHVFAQCISNGDIILTDLSEKAGNIMVCLYTAGRWRFGA